ncbi:MAG: hypothetical protein WA160_10170 [Pseudobdellovibrio sp.]
MNKFCKIALATCFAMASIQAKADLAAELNEREQVAAQYHDEQLAIAAAKEKARHENAIMKAKSDMNQAIVKLNQAVEKKMKAELVETKVTYMVFEESDELFSKAGWLLKLSDGTICKVYYQAHVFITTKYGTFESLGSTVANCIYQNGSLVQLREFEKE